MIWSNVLQRSGIRIVGLKTVANHSDETQAQFFNFSYYLFFSISEI